MIDSGPWFLFASAFISSTLLPGGSEALFATLIWQEEYSPWALLAVATLGNTLGGITSWGIGRLIALRYPAGELTKPSHRLAVERVRRWGSLSLLFSWLPVIGDPLCVAAGWLRVHWFPALILIGAGKAARYAVILYAVS